MSTVTKNVPNVPEFPTEKEYCFDEFSERRAILKERLSRQAEHEMLLESTSQELREHEAKAAKALTDFRATRDELNTQILQYRSQIGQCISARAELVGIAPPELSQKLAKLKESLRKHENYFENLKDMPIRPYMLKKVEESSTQLELTKWQTRLTEFAQLVTPP